MKETIQEKFERGRVKWTPYIITDLCMEYEVDYIMKGWKEKIESDYRGPALLQAVMGVGYAKSNPMWRRRFSLDSVSCPEL